MREKDLIAMYDHFTQYAPDGAALLDIIERPTDWIVIYRDDANPCTPYIIHHLTDSGLYSGRYYDNSYDAWIDFDEMR